MQLKENSATNKNVEFKLSFVNGLKEVVLKEIEKNKNIHVHRTDEDSVYISYFETHEWVLNLKSVSKAYIISRNDRYNPSYITSHKSIVGELIEKVTADKKREFKTFNIMCAGSNSPEVKNINKYIESTFALVKKEEADLKIHIIKVNNTWEVGVQISPRPLSLRSYKIENMSGAMDPTIAYALNSECNILNKKSYLNAFSGSATLLIEAGLEYAHLESLVGFDNNKTHLSLAIQNIKKSGLLTRITLKEKNIYDSLEFGTFDVITADLPFGMAISKGENLQKMYTQFIYFCEKSLYTDGVLAIFTNEPTLLETVIASSKFEIIKILDLKIPTNVHLYLKPKIFWCVFKK